MDGVYLPFLIVALGSSRRLIIWRTAGEDVPVTALAVWWLVVSPVTCSRWEPLREDREVHCGYRALRSGMLRVRLGRLVLVCGR